MFLTIPTLIAAGIAPTQARLFAAPMNAACALHDITTPARLAAFVAQCAHESSGFTALEESLYYRTADRIRAMWPSRVSAAEAPAFCRAPQALANRVYVGRNGNGNEASGDGWRYRGRGLIQLTGRANYRAASVDPGADYETHPDLVSQPDHACLTAAWFWAEHGCNALADAGQIDAITRAINGAAMAGAAERRALYAEALHAFSTEPAAA